MKRSTGAVCHRHLNEAGRRHWQLITAEHTAQHTPHRAHTHTHTRHSPTGHTERSQLRPLLDSDDMKQDATSKTLSRPKTRRVWTISNFRPVELRPERTTRRPDGHTDHHCGGRAGQNRTGQGTTEVLACSRLPAVTRPT